MGTSGTMTGLGQYFKTAKPSVFRLGYAPQWLPPALPRLTNVHSVCTAAGDRVPGPRSLALLSPVEFPWRDSVDAIEEVGSKDAFGLSLQLCREGLICGPSSGFNLQGMLSRSSRAPSTDSSRSFQLPRKAQSRRHTLQSGWTLWNHRLRLHLLRSAVLIR